MAINRPRMDVYLETYHNVHVPGGNQPKVKCPFHYDKRPSATVYRDTDRFICYTGCFDGRAVDVIDIVMDQENLTFPEAVEYVKTWEGTEVESSGITKSTKAQRAKRQQRKRYSFTVKGG